MAIGAYTMAILVLKAGFSFWLSLPIAVLAAMLFGVIVGLPSHCACGRTTSRSPPSPWQRWCDSSPRMRAALPGATRGCSATPTTVGLLSRRLARPLGLDQREHGLQLLEQSRLALPLLLVIWLTVGIATSPSATSRARRGDGCCERSGRTRTRRGRWERTPCSTSSSRWRSRRAWERSRASSSPSTSPRSTRSISSRWSPSSPSASSSSAGWRTTGVALGAVLFWFVFGGPRFIELPDPPFTETRLASLRLAITGLLLIGLMAFRPAGDLREA